MIQARYRRILWFFGRVILSLIGWDILLPRIGFRGLSRRTRRERLRQIAVRFRGLAVQMGGVMIKVGQFLSARLDVLPPEITDELAGLQDEVRPETFEAIRQVVEAEMNAPLESRFAEFERQPLASASIGQVHRARLRGGEDWVTRAGRPGEDGAPVPPVVVKVQRPNIQTIVETDLSALRVVSGWVNAYPPIRRRANVPALLAEFSRSLYEEMDYLTEGSHAETFAANFAGRPDICVPRVFWSHTTRRVLTLEQIEAIKITDYARIEAAGVNRAEVATRLFDTYLKQIFEDRFFHADPHPGNLFVLPAGEAPAGETPGDAILPGAGRDGTATGDPAAAGGAPPSAGWQLVFVDFGMTGTVSPNQFTALREMLVAVGTQDVARLVRSYQIMGVLLPTADLALLEKATQAAFERFWGKSTAEMVNLGHQEAVAFAKEFGGLLYELPFQVPENLILLGRCLGILSGMCTGLDPDFNVWTSVMPYARRLVEAESGGRGVVVEETLRVLRTLISLPGRADALLQRIEQGRLEIQIPELKSQLQRLERRMQRLSATVLFVAFFAGSIQLYLAGAVVLAGVTTAAALLALLGVLLER
jgi:predicted unusual protein kinase regulating ubiquinone biosynthesis (AarF/ABC1/UbiB family)